MAILFYTIPILVGFVFGYFLTLPVNLVATSLAVAVSGVLLALTENAELGSIIGALAVVLALVFILSQWVTFAVSSGAVFSIDLTWLFRGSQ